MLSKSRYQIDVQTAAPPTTGYPAQFHLDETDSYVKYGHQVFQGSSQRGDPYWTAEIITQTWFQAETGRIPISGAGYGGKFTGQGFESLWLDMSEIVRPTRDGIHGREYISTQVDLGGGMMALTFSPNGSLNSVLPPNVRLPIPVLFGPLAVPLPGRGALQAMAIAASRLDTLAMIFPDEFDEDLIDYAPWLAPRLSAETIDFVPNTWQPRYIEIEEENPDQAVKSWLEAGRRWPGAVIGARLPLSEQAANVVESWARAGIPVIHLYADDIGQDLDGRFLVDAIRSVHIRLVDCSRRDQVSLIVSGGIAAAEHVAKSIACGSDLVAIDFAMQIAWGCSLWADKGKCAVENEPIDPEWGAQRLMNLMSAWRDQLLEALGAMGMREVRRLRGEVGRTIWHDTEEALFKSYLGGSQPRSSFQRLPQPAGREGDFRWPTALLLSSQQQAKTGRPPSGDLEYRVGASEGGFDRMAFAFEIERDPREILMADPAGFDFSLQLNRREVSQPAAHFTSTLVWSGHVLWQYRYASDAFTRPCCKTAWNLHFHR